MNYIATIEDVNADEFVSHAYGDFKVTNFATKNGLAQIAGKPGDFRVRIVEVEAVGVEPGENARVICSVTGDHETVTVVAKKKLASERKAQNPEAADAGTDAADETV